MSGKWDARAALEYNAALRLPELAGEYFAAGEGLFGGTKTPEELHGFRLKTKHFRYTLELFEEQYGPRFAELMKGLKPVQDALGEINDAATALGWMNADESPQAREYLEARITEKSAEFEEYWKTVFDKPGERKRWRMVLGKPLRGTKEG